MAKKLIAVLLMMAVLFTITSSSAFADGPGGEQHQGYFYAPLSGDETTGLKERLRTVK